MVTTRRRISTEQDRFGGYGLTPANRTLSDEVETQTENGDRYSFDMIADEPGFVSESRTAYAEKPTSRKSESVAFSQPSVIEYSSRPRYISMEQVRTISAPARVKKSRKREKEDVMPSIRTRAYAQPQVKEEPARETRERTRLSGKTKAALFVYMALALTLAIAVIATGLAVSNINASADAIENEIAIKNERVISQNAEILRLTDPDRVAGAALGNGMEKVENTVDVELIPTVEPVKYEGRTNWFDKFCDWLSKIIGG